MKILNNNNADLRVYEVEFFCYDGDTYYSYTDDIVVDISNDSYDDNDVFHADLFKALEATQKDIYKIRVSELFSIDNVIYRCTYIKDETGIHHIQNERFIK